MISRVTFVVLAAALLAPALDAQSPLKPRTDTLGDPLPEGSIARLGTLRFKHAPAGDPTIDVALFSPDGTKLVSLVYSSGSIRLWDAASGKEISGPWSTANRRYTAVQFSPDSAQLAAAALGGDPGVNGKETGVSLVILYDIAGKQVVKSLLGVSQAVHALGFADGSKTLVCAGGGKVSWWDVAAGKEQRSWKPLPEDKQPIQGGTKSKTFFNCAFSPDARSIAVHAVWQFDRPGQPQQANNESIDHEAIGYDLPTGKIRWRTVAKGTPNNPNQMCRLAFSADGKRVAIALGAARVEVRDANTGKLIAAPVDSPLRSRGFLGGLALTSDGGTAALAGEDSHVIVWNTKEDTPPRKLTARLAQYWGNSTQCLHFAPDNKTLLVGADADLQLYDVATLQEVRPWEGHRGWIDYVAFTVDGRRLLTGCGDMNLYSQELAAWDAKTWKRLQVTSVRTPPWPNLGVMAPDQSAYVGKNDGDPFGLYDLKSGKLLARFTVPGKTGGQTLGFFSPGGKHYLLAGQGGADSQRLYAVPSGKALCELPALSMNRMAMESARPIAFTADERFVALFGQDGMIHVCETATGKVRHRLGRELDPQVDKRQGFIGHLAFSRDGKFLASWNMAENSVRVWDVIAGKDLVQLVPDDLRTNMPGPNNHRARFAWSPDSRMLAVGESKIRLYELATLGVRRELAGHKDGLVRALAFSPDGRVLASGSANTTVLIWDMAPPAGSAVAALTREPGLLDKHWQALAQNDAAKAFAAVGALSAAPAQSVAWIKAHLQPAGAIDAKRVEDLIGRLDDNQYKVRQTAMVELQRLGERVVPAVDKMLAANPALETHLRLHALRKRVTGMVLSEERLQAYRAVEVLERIGTSEARQVLTALAGGAPGALVTSQAQAALERLKSE